MTIGLAFMQQTCTTSIGPGIPAGVKGRSANDARYADLVPYGLVGLVSTDVTRVKFTRPQNFKYQSGQWVCLCCTGFRATEYHSLTLTSPPHENYLSELVKAQRPCTCKLLNYFDLGRQRESMLPKESTRPDRAPSHDIISLVHASLKVRVNLRDITLQAAARRGRFD
ncbi:hypothetical protein HPB51_014306 [Rhipicephalus microplus]|uniref:FAD-binding 8 domain-containing protein n=1 Tax=Rhipicephalus microplus TaxID=6941 RepID=A0A9J6D9V7_RHIMP|nr:hypothetical protein HPB51_014306 [Rhipicephalus microplus]